VGKDNKNIFQAARKIGTEQKIAVTATGDHIHFWFE
jgi:hypothetical protein